MYKKIAFSLGIGVLLWQLAAVTVVFPIEQFSYGELSMRIQHAKIAVTRYTELAVNVSAAKPVYESLVFVGDILLARNVEIIMNRDGNDFPFEGFALSSLSSRPAIIGNFESSMTTPHITTLAYQMRFSTHESFLPSLKNAGFTHTSLANNHSLDYGEDAYQNAFSKLEETGVVPFGHGTALSEDSISYIKTTKGNIALIGIHASAAIPDERLLEAIFREAAAHSYLQIAYVHWGDEYVLVHNRTQESFAKSLVDVGADLIVGHHPHVVQDVERIDGVLVFYSLGNYIFDQYFSQDVQEGLVLSLDVSDEPLVHLVPVTSAETLSQPTLMKTEEHEDFLAALAARSQSELSEAIKSGIVPLTLSVATSTEMAIMVR